MIPYAVSQHQQCCDGKAKATPKMEAKHATMEKDKTDTLGTTRPRENQGKGKIISGLKL